MLLLHIQELRFVDPKIQYEICKINVWVRVRFIVVFNATFSNISVISWRSVLLVE